MSDHGILGMSRIVIFMGRLVGRDEVNVSAKYILRTCECDVKAAGNDSRMRALFLASKTRNDGDRADMFPKDASRLLERRTSSSAKSEAQGTLVRALFFRMSRLSEIANDQLSGIAPPMKLKDTSILVQLTC